MVPLVIAPTGGEGVQRTFATARSVEYDALVLAGNPEPAPDAYGARDAKVSDDAEAVTDIDSRVLTLVTEAFRHGKPIAAHGDGEAVLEAVGLTGSDAGVAAASGGGDALERLIALLRGHRVWNRFRPAL
jgi:catalase